MDSNIYSPMKSETEPIKRGISGSTLKLTAIVTMLIDHTAATILERLLRSENNYDGLLYNVYYIMRSIGRLAFPIFCFLLVEGMIHTHNKWKYAMRLSIFALISEVPFDLAFYGRPLYWGYQNVFFTLLIGLLVMIGFSTVNGKWSDRKWLPALAVAGVFLTGYISIKIISYGSLFIGHLFRLFHMDVSLRVQDGESILLAGISTIVLFLVFIFMCRIQSLQSASAMFADLAVLMIGIKLADLLETDYSGFGVLAIAIMYMLRKNYMNAMLGGCTTLTVMSIGEYPSFVDLILIRFYNGKRGLNLKYVFYAFYPVHLFLLYLICYFMKLV